MHLTAKSFLGLAVFAAAGISQTKIVTNQPNPLEISQRGLAGRRAPSFALPDMAMKQYDILDYRGRWLMVEYIKTDSEPAIKLVKALESLKARLGAKLAVLAVVVPPDNTATVGRFAAATKTTTPILFDSGQTAMWYFKATPQKPSFDSPHVFAISPQGLIAHDWNSVQIEDKAFAVELEALVGGAPDKK